VNARSGRCPQDCAFCSQSAFHKTDASEYPLIGVYEIADAACAAADAGARSFGIVTSGASLGGDEFEAVLEAIRIIRNEGRIAPDASIGLITKERAARLADAGCRRYHHNLEACRSFYGSICTTRTYDDNVSSVRAAQDAGLEVCSGGIFGMGETPRQRVELLIELRALGVESIPINFLSPISGTRLGGMEKLGPLEALQIIAVARMLMGGRNIRVCGGREAVLGGLQGLMFFAGANGAMVGDYLTTRGRSAAGDIELLKKTGMEW
jgi:biotin synthase